MVETAQREIAVVGAGFMGAVIATLYARHGYRVLVTDVNAEALKTIRRRARPIAVSMAGEDNGPDAILAGIVMETSLEKAVAGAFFVHEVIHENLEAKQALFAKLDELCGPHVVLGTNTSSFRLSEICRYVQRCERVLGVHYVTPAHIIKVVELITTDSTPPSLVAWGRSFLKTVGHVGVVCKDTPGFLINRLQYALLSEAYRIVEEGVSSRDDVDAAMRLSIGPRLALWGPLLTEDLVVSKRTTAAVWDYLRDNLREGFDRPPAVTRFVETGRLGAISGEGWYRFACDHDSIVSSRDSQLKSLLDWLERNERIDDFKLA